MKQKKRLKAPLKDVLRILYKYRKKSSLLFLIKWAIIKKPDPDMNRLTVPFFLQSIGAWDGDTHQLWAIYQGLKIELGPIISLSAAVEIYQAAEDRRLYLKNKTSHQEQQQLLKKKKKLLKKKYGSNIPEKFLLEPEKRSEKTIRLKELHKQKLFDNQNKKKKRKEEALQRARKISQIRLKKNL